MSFRSRLPRTTFDLETLCKLYTYNYFFMAAFDFYCLLSRISQELCSVKDGTHSFKARLMPLFLCPPITLYLPLSYFHTIWEFPFVSNSPLVDRTLPRMKVQLIFLGVFLALAMPGIRQCVKTDERMN